MKIVKLTSVDTHESLYLNIDHIISFQSTDDNQQTKIVTDVGYYFVTENIDDVLFLVSE